MSRIKQMCTMGLTGGLALAAQAGMPGLLEPVRVEERPAVWVAYVEQVGGFQGNGAIYDVLLEKLLAWAIPENRWDFPESTQIVCIYPDEPSVSPEEQRLWLGITLTGEATPPAGIQTLQLPSGSYAVGRFAITADDFGEAWKYLYGEWLPQSGRAPSDGLAFEIQRNDSSEDPEQKHRVDICIPVR